MSPSPESGPLIPDEVVYEPAPPPPEVIDVEPVYRIDAAIDAQDAKELESVRKILETDPKTVAQDIEDQNAEWNKYHPGGHWSDGLK